MAGVRFEGVTKRFGEATVLQEMSIDIADGEFIVIVGPSGCGKTTFLRLLAGLEKATSGRISIGGRPVNDLSPKDRDVAMVFQSYALYPHMTVYDNMAFGLRMRGKGREEISMRVQEAARMLEIENLLRRKPRQLSGGQRQRVALGRAVVREPAAFLLDEPLSNLDARLRVQTRAELVGLQRRLGATFVYVTHDQVEAMTMAERIAVMDKGVRQQVGRPRDLYESPANIFVAGFIGSPAMNFVEMRVEGEGRRLRVEADGFSLPWPESKAPAFAPCRGRKIVLGIRPEDIHLLGRGLGGDSLFPVRAQVEGAEFTGSECYLSLRCGNAVLVSRSPGPVEVSRGDTLEVLFDMARAHAFDPESGGALRGPLSPGPEGLRLP